MFIDSHCHLDLPCFSEGLDNLLLQLDQNKITKIIIPSLEASRWEALQLLSKKNPSIYYALGIHPHFVDRFNKGDFTKLDSLILTKDDKCIAIGEIGLDKFSSVDQSLQESIFIKQLHIAQKENLPIILHCVKKQGRILEILKDNKFVNGAVYHAFSGSLEVANEFIKLGFKLGVGGIITYDSSIKTKETISKVPIESLVLETDAPDMPIYNQETKYNTPLNIITIFNCLAELREESKSVLVAQIYKNSCSIFSLNND